MPYEEEIVEIASTFSVKSYLLLRVIIMGTIGLHMVMQHGKMLIPKKEAANLSIMNHTARRDITVTQDIGRASKNL
jgi:uncharacterized protein YaiI (UPF0178 family)